MAEGEAPLAKYESGEAGQDAGVALHHSGGFHMGMSTLGILHTALGA